MKNGLHTVPLTSTVCVFRSRKAGRLKLIHVDGTRIVVARAMVIAAHAYEAAKDVVIASKGEHTARKDERVQRPEKRDAVLNHAAPGRKSEKPDPDRFDLALEELETAMAVIHAEDDCHVTGSLLGLIGLCS